MRGPGIDSKAHQPHSGLRRRVALWLLSLALPTLAVADMTVIYEVETGRKGSMRTSQVVTDSMVRTSDGTTDTIFMIDTGEMILIDHRKEEFYRTSIDEMNAAFAELDENLGSNPMVRRMMMGKAKNVEVEEGPNPQTIADYYCQHYIVTMGEGMRIEIWATSDLETPRPYWDAKKLSYASMGPIGSRFKSMLEAMREIDGFPLQTHINARVMGIRSNSESTAVEVQLGQVADDAFDIPDGYQEGESPFAR